MLRATTLFALLLVSICSFAQIKVPSSDEILRAAYAQANTENKNVLVIFHASWCGWCHKMDESLKDKNVRPLIDQYYITAHLTVYESKEKKGLENPGAIAFLTQHGGANQGLPYWLVLDKNGNLLADSQYKPGENSGCPASETEVAYLISVLKKTSALAEEQLQVIGKRFRQNE